MAERPIVILHGWSDTSESFKPLAGLLRAEMQQPKISIISLADYISMGDEIRFDDLVTAMDYAWNDHGLPRDKCSVNAIVHSTGGLVIRAWLQHYFEPDKAPIKNLVMLAPANFGSPLAHKGRSFIARAWKGFIAKRSEGRLFETGTQILKGLELASPFTWQLAERDRFGHGGKMYDLGNVLCTVLVGNVGYEDIRAIANKEGSDGTVRISTANMECARIEAKFPANPDRPGVGHDVQYRLELSTGMTAFGIMDGHNHSSITLSSRKSLPQVGGVKRDQVLFNDIIRALTVTDKEFRDWCSQLSERNDQLLHSAAKGRNQAKHGFQNTVVRVEDQYGVGVEDYLLEFYEKDHDRIAKEFHTSAVQNVHKYSDDESYRSIYIDCTRLNRSIDKVNEFLSVSVTASPEISDRSPAGFTTIGDDGIGGIRIEREKINEFFVSHRTALVTLQLTRQQLPKVFRFNEFSENS